MHALYGAVQTIRYRRCGTSGRTPGRLCASREVIVALLMRHGRRFAFRLFLKIVPIYVEPSFVPSNKQTIELSARGNCSDGVTKLSALGPATAPTLAGVCEPCRAGT